MGDGPRALTRMETGAAFSNICISAVVDGTLTREEVQDAFAAVQTRHPFFNMAMEATEGGFKFVLPSPPPVIPVEDVPHALEVRGFLYRIMELSRLPFHYASMARIFLYHCTVTRSTELHFIFNHCGCDAQGVMLAIHDVLRVVASRKLLKEAVINDGGDFVNPLDRIPKPLPESWSTYDLPSFLLSPTQSVLPQGAKGFSDGIFYELDADGTKKLLDICHARKISVQAVLSVGSLLAAVKVSGKSLPQVVRGVCPANIRKYLKPEIMDRCCVSGSTMCLWSQHISLDSTLYELLSSATTTIRAEVSALQPLKTWWQFENGAPVAVYGFTAAAGSIGVCPIERNYGGGLTVSDVRIFGGTYDNPNRYGLITHLLTWGGSFRVVVNFSGSEISHATAEIFATMQRKVMEAICGGLDLPVSKLLEL